MAILIELLLKNQTLQATFHWPNAWIVILDGGLISTGEQSLIIQLYLQVYTIFR